MQPTEAMVNAYIPGQSALDPETEARITRRAAVLGPAYRLMYADPVVLDRGEGVWLYAPDGKRYLDVYNNVCSLGHCHPHVVQAIQAQVARLATNTRYLTEGAVDLAERLLATLPAEIGHVMYTCSGSEANDLALRVAEHHTGGTGIIVTQNAYHGITKAVAAFSPSLGAEVPLGVHVRQIPAPDAYRLGVEGAGQAFLAGLEAAIADLRRHGIKPAALIVDSVFTSDGLMPETGAEGAGFLVQAAAMIRAAGGLFIADEVQPGFLRTGTQFWGFQRHGVLPDIVTMGKPMGNGYPVAGLAARPEVIADFGRKARYFNTFAGNNVAMAAGLAVMDVLQAPGMADHVQRVGAYFLSQLRLLAEAEPRIGDTRGTGLFVTAEFVTDPQTKTPDAATAAALVNGLRDEGILISASGRHGNALKMRPPLIITEAEVDLVITAMRKVLARI